MADIINHDDDRELTSEEIKEYQKKLDDSLEPSNEVVKNFKLYFAVYSSNRKHQISHLTEEEYKLLQDPTKCNTVKSLKEFNDDLEEGETFEKTKLLMLTEDNYAMAFHPFVWSVLKLKERIAAMRIAFRNIMKRDVTEFCNVIAYNAVMVGTDYQGELNIGAIIARAYKNGSWYLFRDLCDTENRLKFNKYFNIRQAKKGYNYITDFDSFEEMRYNSPIEPKEIDFDKLNDRLKALVLEQIHLREQRKNELKAAYTILEHSEELKGYMPAFDNDIQKSIDENTKRNKLVAKELGYSQKDIDEEYLKIKVDLFNNCTKEEYNKIAVEYNKIVDELKELRAPLLETTKEWREKRDNLKKELENAQDIIEKSLIEDEINVLIKKINKVYDKKFKKQKKLIDELSEKSNEMYAELQELDSHIITFEDAKNHFKDYFDSFSKFEINANTADNETNKDKKTYTIIPDDEELELN